MQVRNEVKELRLLFEVLQILDSASDLSDNLETVLEVMAEHTGMMRGVMASTAALAIIPMADWLEEPSASRMNTPGVAQGNWQWRVDEKKLTPALAREIKAMTVRYFRAPATRK